MNGGIDPDSGPVDSTSRRWPQKSWSTFRGWPNAAQIACWVVAALVAVGSIGAAAGSSPKKTSATTTAATHSSALQSSSSISAPADQPDRLHPSATLTPGATFATVTKDEVCTRGYSVMLGYWSDPEATGRASVRMVRAA